MLMVATGAGHAVSDTYRLQPGDVISLAVVGMADLDRLAPVDAEGRARLPLVGATEVGGLTIDEVTAAVAATLAEVAGVSPETVLMEVAEYRPVYVIGAARGAGVVPFRPGMTVLQAATEASSALSTDDLRLLELIEAGRTETAVDARTERLAELRMARARLLAERDDATLEAEGLRPEGLDPETWDAIVDRQSSVLTERRRAHAAQLLQFDALEALFSARVEALADEIAVQDERIVVLEADLDQIMSLGAAGLATQERISAVRTRLLEAQLGRLRALSDRTEAEGDRVLAVEGRRQALAQRDLDLAERLQAVEAEAADVALQLRQARRDRDVAVAEVGLGGVGGAPLTESQFRVHREAGDGTLDTLPAFPGDRLVPGDVLEVVR